MTLAQEGRATNAAAPLRYVLLGDVCRTTSGGTPSRGNPAYFEGTIPWVKSGELPDGPVADIQETITEAALANSSAKLFPAGTLLIALYGATIGKLGVLTRDAATNQAVCAVFPSSVLEQKYLFWFLRFKRRALIESAIGGAQPNISQGILRNLEVPLPTLYAQRNVVAEIEKQFSRLDEAVANLKRVRANLKRYKAAVLKAAVEGRLVPTEAELAQTEGRTYETGSELLQRILTVRRKKWNGKGEYKEAATPNTAEFPALPSEWVWANVGQIGLVVSGLTKNPTRDAFSMKLPYLRVANVYANELRLDEITEIGIAENELEKLLLLKDDLLIVEGNGSPDQIGRVALWDGSINPCVHQNHLIKVRIDIAEPRFVLNWLLSPHGRNQIERATSSTSGLHTLSTGKIARLTIPLPPLAEQRRIVEEIERRLSLIRGVETQTDANLKRAERMRQAVLRTAFTASQDARQY